MSRISVDFWIAAYSRRVQNAGGYFAVLTKGNTHEGNVVILITNGRDNLHVFEPITDFNAPERAHERLWHSTHRFTSLEAIQKYDDTLARMRKRDPDMWVLEVDDQQLRHFLSPTELL